MAGVAGIGSGWRARRGRVGVRARARECVRRGTMGRARHRLGSSLKKRIQGTRGCSTRLGRRRRAFRAVTWSEVVSKGGQMWESEGKTHDGVCRVRSELGKSARVEDVCWKDITQGGKSLDVGGGSSGSVVRHSSGCLRRCSMVYSKGESGKLRGAVCLKVWSRESGGRIYTRSINHSLDDDADNSLQIQLLLLHLPRSPQKGKPLQAERLPFSAHHLFR